MPLNVILLGELVQQELVKKIYPRLKKIDIPCTALGVTSSWYDHRENLADKLRSSSHLIVLYPGKITDWFQFVEGFAAGREPKGIVFCTASDAPLVAEKTILPIFSDVETLTTYLNEEKICRERLEKQREARDFIVNAGIGLSEENLALCVQEGKIDFVERFLILGYSPDSKNEKGVPILILSIRNHHTNLARLLIEAGADVNRISADRGSSALMEAAALGDIDMVKELLEHGANPDLISKNGQTALMLSIGEGKLEVAKLLIQHRADLSIVDALGMSARKYAELFKHQDVVALIDKQNKAI